MAEMAKLYLWNSHTQAKCKAHKAIDAIAATPDVPTNPRLDNIRPNTGQSGVTTGMGDDSDSNSNSNSNQLLFYNPVVCE
jgi:hypothetical protein